MSLSPVINENSLIFESVIAKNEGKKSISLSSIMKTKLNLQLKPASEGLQVLIVHTHATEAYSPTGEYYVSDDEPRAPPTTPKTSFGWERAGKALEAGGIRTLHDKTHHDHPASQRQLFPLGEHHRKVP